jgi:hypothetical protein
MQFSTIPAIANYLHLVRFERRGSGDESSLDVDAGDESISRQLILRRVAGSSHEEGFTILREGN